MDAWRERVVAEARSWLGTPWRHLAAAKGAGVDCAQLLRMVYTDAGLVEPFDTGYYPADWMMHRSEERLLEWIERYMVPAPAALPGDVAAWHFGRCFSHGAIVVEWPVVIHAFRKERGVVWGDASLGDLSRHAVRLYTRRT